MVEFRANVEKNLFAGSTYRVGYDKNVGFGCRIGSSFCQVSHNGRVGVEQICMCFSSRKSAQTFVLSIPSLVIPGFLGTPAGITALLERFP